MRLLICGTRGSTPSPGQAFVRYGGQTSCVAVAHGDDDPHLVLDGGTGLRRLTTFLDGRTFSGTILIGHLHWDHTHGLPFFRAGDQPDAHVRVLIPEQGDAADVMARAVSPPHFPVRLEELRGEWTVESLFPGTSEIEGFEVTALDIPHKASRTFGFRVSDGTSSIAYLSDHWPTAIGPGSDGFGEYHESALALASDVDLLIHDAQYTTEEFAARADFGHSAIDYPVGLARKAGARAVLLFHHDPDRTDDDLDRIVASLQDGSRPHVSAAAEGSVIELS
ncbi:MAG: MBL fold metallo-hydrolase [Actinomycetota bacterium]